MTKGLQGKAMCEKNDSSKALYTGLPKIRKSSKENNDERLTSLAYELY
jgi:hypothetical protein